MLKKLFSVLSAALILSVSLQAAPLDGPAAMVNLTANEVITKKQLQQRFEETEKVRIQAGLPIPPQTEDQVLDTMIAEILIKQAAERDGVYVTDTEVDNALEKQRKNAELQLRAANQLKATESLDSERFKNLMEEQTRMTWEEIRGSIRKQLTQQKYTVQTQADTLSSIKPPTEADIQAEYSKNATKLVNPELVRFSQIIISTINKGDADYAALQEKAEDALLKLKRGADFSSVVTEYTDDAKSRYSGGEFGYIARDDSRAEAYFGSTFFNKLFTLEPGTFSDVLRSNIGFHIVKILEHRDAKMLKLDDLINPTSNMTVRESISRMIINERQQNTFRQAYINAVEKLKEQADIRVFE